MSKIPRFAQYAAAFEKAYAANDWSLVEPFFTEDAVYEVKDLPPPLGGKVEGRDAILAYFDRVLNDFDRRFTSRVFRRIDGPHEDADSVWLRGGALYGAAGVPDLDFELEEQAWFDGDRIRRLEDRYDRKHVDTLLDYARAHGAKLGIHWE